MKTLFSPPSLDDFLRLLRAWRFWLFGALLGGLLGASFYALFPPPYRAQATIVVDFNAEKAWPVDSDKELFYYLDREARKLEEVAWADTTLQKVAAETGFSVPELRAAKLELSQPEDGGWHFYATDIDARVADKLASAWAREFIRQTRQGLDTAVQLEAARKKLADNPNDADLQATISKLEAASLGITPELQLSASQVENLPVTRKTGLGSYVFAGAGLFLALGALFFLFFSRQTHAG